MKLDRTWPVNVESELPAASVSSGWCGAPTEEEQDEDAEDEEEEETS